MNSRLTGMFALASMVLLSGCATPGVQTESLISAAEFDAMIHIEVRETEPELSDDLATSVAQVR